jgi:putative heme iron utilization protein
MTFGCNSPLSLSPLSDSFLQQSMEKNRIATLFYKATSVLQAVAAENPCNELVMVVMVVPEVVMMVTRERITTALNTLSAREKKKKDPLYVLVVVGCWS